MGGGGEGYGLVFCGEKGSGSGLAVNDPLILSGTVGLEGEEVFEFIVDVGFEGDALGVPPTDGPLDPLLEPF